MVTKTLSNSIFLAFIFAALAVGVSVHAQTTSSGSTFPITELGNCADRTACKTYCDTEANRSVCASYAQSHGLKRSQQTQQRAPDRSKLLEAISADGGPGKCGVGATDPVQTCKIYCDSTAHIETCVAYAKSHSLFTGEKLEKAEKVSEAIKNGVSLPSGCTDAKSCKEACENPSTVSQASSCLSFAKAAGLLPPGFNEGAAKKIFSAIASSSAPFKVLKDFAQCNGATDPDIVAKCSDFAAQSGLITQEQAQKLQRNFMPRGDHPMGTSTQNGIPRPIVGTSTTSHPMMQEGFPLPRDRRQPSHEGRNATTTSFLGFVGQTAAAFFSGLFH